jgi:hypothetical protein
MVEVFHTASSEETPVAVGYDVDEEFLGNVGRGVVREQRFAEHGASQVVLVWEDGRLGVHAAA